MKVDGQFRPENDSHHNETLSKKDIHYKNELLSKIYYRIFLLSFILLIGTIIINVIFAYKHIFIPRIFFPGVVIYIVSFVLAGGGYGSYGNINKSEVALMYMRKCTSIVMLTICFVLFPIFLYQNINLFSSIKDSHKYCLDNKGKSKGDIYSDLLDLKEKTYGLRNNYNYKYKNGLTCFENQKCIRSVSSSKIFVCNYNHEEKYKNTSSCNKVFETDQIVNTFDSMNMAYFVTSCLELKKEKIRPDISIYKCISGKNLAMEDSVTKEEQNEMDQYNEKKIKNYDQQIFDTQKKLENLSEDIYSYDDTCLSNKAYITCLIAIIAFILANLIIVVTWGFIGISNILKTFGIIEDIEMKYYREKVKKMNSAYNEAYSANNNQNSRNENDESTPIIIK